MSWPPRSPHKKRGVNSPSEKALTDVKIDLHHLHLPELDEVGVIDYDPEVRVVKPNDAVARSDETGVAVGASSHGRSVPPDELRRYVGEYFDASGSETASLDDLSRYAATRFTDSDGCSAERIQLRFHHVVLPRLDDVGVIDYDPRTTTVRYRTDSS